MGIYVFRKTVLLDALHVMCGSGLGFDFGHDIIPLLVHSVRSFAYEFRSRSDNQPSYWRDIGTIDGYYEASMDLLKPDKPFDPYAAYGLSPSPRIMNDEPRVDATAFVSNTILSTGVQIERNAVIIDSVVMPGVHIGEGAQIRCAIVEEGVHFPDRFWVGFDRQHDRRKHTVSERGVAVITLQPTRSIERPWTEHSDSIEFFRNPVEPQI
jgi:glucose-1-phosphate adenylyltransferase